MAKTAQPAAYQAEERDRAAATGPYHFSQAARRRSASPRPMPSTRSSLPGEAAVVSVNRCLASRSFCAPCSWAVRSTTGRQEVAATVGMANRTSRISTGLTVARSATVMASRRIQPPVENTDMYMWSRVKTCSRSTDSRSRYSGRSWCAIVEIEAWSRATCASSAIVTLSRKRRCTLVETVCSSQVATAETASAMTAKRSRPAFCSIRPSPSSLSQTASSASGSADTKASTNETPMSEGSQRKPSRHSRHIEDSAGGSLSGTAAGGTAVSGEDIETQLFLAFLRRAGCEPLRLQGEHRPVTTALRHQLVVTAQLEY